MRRNTAEQKGKPSLLLVLVAAALVLGAGLVVTVQAGQDIPAPIVSGKALASESPAALLGAGDSPQDAGIHAQASDSGATVSEEPAAGGMRAFIDPNTGELRAPTREEIKALQPKRTPVRAAPQAGPAREIAGPHGAKGMKLDQSFMVNEVVKKNADGSLSMECITGDENAANAVMKGQAASAPAKREDRHEK